MGLSENIKRKKKELVLNKALWKIFFSIFGGRKLKKKIIVFNTNSDMYHRENPENYMRAHLQVDKFKSSLA